MSEYDDFSDVVIPEKSQSSYDDFSEIADSASPPAPSRVFDVPPEAPTPSPPSFSLYPESRVGFRVNTMSGEETPITQSGYRPLRGIDPNQQALESVANEPQRQSEKLYQSMLKVANEYSAPETYGKRDDRNYERFAELVAKEIGSDKVTPELVKVVKPVLDSFDLLKMGPKAAKSAPPEMRNQVLEAAQYYISQKDKDENPGWWSRTGKMAAGELAKTGEAIAYLNPFESEEDWKFHKNLTDVMTDPARFTHPDQGFVSRNLQGFLASIPKMGAAAMGGGTPGVALTFGVPTGVNVQQSIAERGGDELSSVGGGLLAFGLETALWSKMPGKFFSQLGEKTAAEKVIDNASRHYILETLLTGAKMEGAGLQAKIVEELGTREGGGKEKPFSGILKEAVAGIPDTAFQAILFHAPGLIQGMAELSKEPSRKEFEAAGGWRGSKASQREEIAAAARLFWGSRSESEMTDNPIIGDQARPPEVKSPGKIEAGATNIPQDQWTNEQFQAKQKQTEADKLHDDILEQYRNEGQYNGSIIKGIQDTLQHAIDNKDGNYSTFINTRKQRGTSDGSLNDEDLKIIKIRDAVAWKMGYKITWGEPDDNGTISGKLEKLQGQQQPPVNPAQPQGVEGNGELQKTGSETGSTEESPQNQGVQREEVLGGSAPEANSGIPEASAGDTGSESKNPPDASGTPASSPENINPPYRSVKRPKERIIVDQEAIRSAELKDLPSVVVTAIKEEIENILSPKRVRKIGANRRLALNEILRGGELNEGVKEARNDIFLKLSGQKESGRPGQPDYEPAMKDPLFSTIAMEPAERSDAIDAAINSVEAKQRGEGELDELAGRVDQLIGKETGVEFGNEAEVKKALNQLRGKSKFSGADTRAEWEKKIDAENDPSSGTAPAEPGNFKGMFDALDDLGSYLKEKKLFSNPVFDPNMYIKIGKVAAEAIRGGVKTLEDFLKQVGAKAPEYLAKFGKEFESAWKEEWEKVAPPEESKQKEPPAGPERSEPKGGITPGATSPKHASSDDLIAKAGLEPREGVEPITDEQRYDEASRKMKANPNLATDVVSEVLEANAFGGDPDLGAEKQTILGIHIRELENARLRGEANMDEYNDAIRADIVAGRAAGRELQSRQAELAEDDMTLTGMTKRFVNNHKRGPNASESEELRVRAKGIADLTARVKELESLVEAKRETNAFDVEVAKIHKEMADRRAELAAKKKAEQEKNGMTRVDYDKDGNEIRQPQRGNGSGAGRPVRKPTKEENKAKSEEKKQAIRKEIDSGVTELLDAIRKVPGVKSVGIPMPDPEWTARVVKAAVKIARGYVKLGKENFYQAFKQLREDFGDKVAEEMKAAMSGAWNELEKNKEVPIPEQQLRTKFKTDMEYRIAVSKEAQKILRDVVSAGDETRKIDKAYRDEINKNVHDILVKEFPEITENQTREAISGYRIRKELKKDWVSVQTRSVRGQDLQLSKIEDLEKGILSGISGLENRTPDDFERDLIKRVNQLVREGNWKLTPEEAEAKRAQRSKTALETAKTVLKNKIRDMSKEIDDGKRIVNGRSETIPDAELTRLREEYAWVKEGWDAIFKPALTEADRIDAAIKLIDRMNAKLEADNKAGNISRKPKPDKLHSIELDKKRAERELLLAARDELRKNDPKYKADELARKRAEMFTRLRKSWLDWTERRAWAEEGKPVVKKVKPTEIDRQLLDAQYKVELAKRQAKQAEEDYANEKRSTTDKILGIPSAANSAVRAITLGWDLSYVLRQGKFLAFESVFHPARMGQNLVKSISAWKDKGDFAIAEELRNRENAPLYYKFGLDISAQKGTWSQQEEWLWGKWTEKIPVLSNLEKIGRAYLNLMRADFMDADIANYTRDGRNLNIESGKVLANFINVCTGRGPLGAFEPAARAFAEVFTAPRFTVSRFQYLLGQPMWQAIRKGDPQARKIIATHYVKQLVGGMAYYATIGFALNALSPDERRKLFGVSMEGTSSNFMKLRFGNSYIDPLAGCQQSAVLLNRIFFRENKNRANEESIGRFVRGRLTPFWGTAADCLFENSVIDEKDKPTFWGVVAKLTVPITYRDMLKVFKEQGIAQGTAMQLLTFWGESIQTYKTKPKKKSGETILTT